MWLVSFLFLFPFLFSLCLSSLFSFLSEIIWSPAGGSNIFETNTGKEWGKYIFKLHSPRQSNSLGGGGAPQDESAAGIFFRPNRLSSDLIDGDYSAFLRFKDLLLDISTKKKEFTPLFLFSKTQENFIRLYHGQSLRLYYLIQKGRKSSFFVEPSNQDSLHGITFIKQGLFPRLLGNESNY